MNINTMICSNIDPDPRSILTLILVTFQRHLSSFSTLDETTTPNICQSSVDGRFGVTGCVPQSSSVEKEGKLSSDAHSK